MLKADNAIRKWPNFDMRIRMCLNIHLGSNSDTAPTTTFNINTTTYDRLPIRKRNRLNNIKSNRCNRVQTSDINLAKVNDKPNKFHGSSVFHLYSIGWNSDGTCVFCFQTISQDCFPLHWIPLSLCFSSLISWNGTDDYKISCKFTMQCVVEFFATALIVIWCVELGGVLQSRCIDANWRFEVQIVRIFPSNSRLLAINVIYVIEFAYRMRLYVHWSNTMRLCIRAIVPNGRCSNK